MPKVLVVDDSDNMRSFIKSTIEKAGHDVVEARDGVEALDLAKKNSDVKLVVSDYNMPNMDGIALCKALKDHNELKVIPFLMLTTEGSQALKDMGKQAGVLAWVTKPFTPEKLTNVVTKIFSK